MFLSVLLFMYFIRSVNRGFYKLLSCEKKCQNIKFIHIFGYNALIPTKNTSLTRLL